MEEIFSIQRTLENCWVASSKITYSILLLLPACKFFCSKALSSDLNYLTIVIFNALKLEHDASIMIVIFVAVVMTQKPSCVCALFVAKWLFVGKSAFNNWSLTTRKVFVFIDRIYDKTKLICALKHTYVAVILKLSVL